MIAQRSLECSTFFQNLHAKFKKRVRIIMRIQRVEGWRKKQKIYNIASSYPPLYPFAQDVL